MALPWGAPLTDRDLRDLPDDGHRYELVDGTLLVTPAPGTRHQLCVVHLLSVLHASRPPGMTVLVAPYDVRVSASTVLQPDLLVFRTEDLGEIALDVAPLLVVEILSPSTRLVDLGTKRLAYEAAGVPAYWVVDPVHPSLTVLHLEAGRYAEQVTVSGDTPYPATFPFEVTVVPADLVDPDR